jgi:hypothetical protein
VQRLALREVRADLFVDILVVSDENSA